MGLTIVAGPQGVRAAQQPLLSEPFTGTTVSNPAWTPASNAGAASRSSMPLPCLTATVNTTATPVAGCATRSPALPPGGDPSGGGVLRLTNNVDYQATILVDHESRPFDVGLIADFDVYMYAKGMTNAPADGISFFLADGSVPITSPGAYGGGLGYAPIGGIKGLPGGYMAVGVDELGNFEQQLTDGSGCTHPPSALLPAPRVGLRGPGSGTTGYCLVASSGALPGALDSPAATTRASAAKRHVHIVIDEPCSLPVDGPRRGAM
ncbi:MAG TPA: hypothetical protein VEY89_10795, partial [Candidatus Dormibacteraeota bacterium]|nr:hypothetical protein [Candidatus Dormibacteraeota bacterium]